MVTEKSKGFLCVLSNKATSGADFRDSIAARASLGQVTESSTFPSQGSLELCSVYSVSMHYIWPGFSPVLKLGFQVSSLICCCRCKHSGCNAFQRGMYFTTPGDTICTVILLCSRDLCPSQYSGFAEAFSGSCGLQVRVVPEFEIPAM